MPTPSPERLSVRTASRNDELSYEYSFLSALYGILGGLYVEGSNVRAALDGDTGAAALVPPLLGFALLDPPPQPSASIAAARPVTPMCNTPRRRTAVPPMACPNSKPSTVWRHISY